MRHISTIIIAALMCTGCTRPIREYTETCDVLDAKVQVDGVGELPPEWGEILMQWQQDRQATGIPKAKEVGKHALRFRSAKTASERISVARSILASLKALRAKK